MVTSMRSGYTVHVRAQENVWEQGWTPSIVQRAIAVLGEAVTSLPASCEPQDRKLAGELVRWLQYGANTSMETVVRNIQQCRPLSQNAPHWDELDALLDSACTMDTLLVQLRERYPDPVSIVISLLKEVAPPGVPWSERTQDPAICAHRQAFDVLIAFATKESLTYVLERLDLFDWENVLALEQLIRPNVEVMKALAVELWPTLAWRARARVVAFLKPYQCIDDDTFRSLVTADVTPMSDDDRRYYLEALGNCRDERVLSRLDEILDMALTALSAGVPGAQSIVRIAIRQYEKLATEPSAARRELAEAHGVRWVPRAPWYAGA
jgi:hypothetical protein